MKPLIHLSILAATALFGLLFVQALASAANASETTTSKPSGATVEKGIVILVEFPDAKHAIHRNPVQLRFSRQLNSYIREMSYNKVSLEVDVTKTWHRLPDSIGRYKISPRNLEVDKSRVRKLIDDALNAADEEVDFSKYSFAAIFMGVEMTDYGMIGLCGYPGMLGWTSDDVLKAPSGERIQKGVAIFCYQAHLGTLFHDIAHILGGVKQGRRMVPCLYDHDLQAKPGPLRETAVEAMINMGFWDPMSCHFIQRGVPPPGISSWTKLRLNWIDPAKVKIVKPGQKSELTLGPLEDGSSETLVIRIPLSPTTYYLIENRQPLGFDRYLPGSGVLIMYCDDSIPECRQGRAPVKLVNADPSIPRLEGAAFDAGRKDSFRDQKNRISVTLQQKIGGSYRVVISPL